MSSKCSKNKIYQLVPEGLDQDSFRKTIDGFHTELRAYCSIWPNQSYRSASPYPIFTPRDRIHEVTNLHRALIPALVAMVRKWWTRPDFHSVIPLSPKMERVLRTLEKARPYSDLQLGSIRPDYLIPNSDEESFRICEINARFMFNGFFIGTWMSCANKGNSFPEEYAATTCSNEQLFAAFDQLVDRKKPIGFVTHKELQRNHDLPLYQDHCEQGRIVNPTDLRLVPSRTRPSGVALSDGTGILDQLMLELHQDELEALDEDLLIELGKVCWNDYRTIYFVHDKRMLGLLRRELKWLVASGDITAAQADILRNGLAETYLCGDPVFRSALFSTKPAEKNNWVLKKCMSGKGDGMVFGKDIDEETWKDMLSAEFLMSCADRSFSGSNRGSSSSRSSSRSSSTGRTTDSSAGGSSGNVSGISSPDEDAPNAKPMISDSLGQNNHGHYVLQRYVKQKKLDMIVQDKDCENLTMLRVKWYVVGTMTCVNRTLLAPAYYRTNNTDIVAVGRGGLMIIAASDPDLTFTYTLPGPEEKVESELQPAMDAELKPEPGPNSKPEQGESKPGPAGQLAAVEHQEASTANLLTVPSDARVVAGALEATETEIEFVKNSLMKYGLAVVDMELDDPASEYMVDIIKSLGEPLEHSSRHGILWDVKPIEGMDSKRGARSETMESFPWHTDCSFEHSPPRYFALHILHRDRFGGGKLRLVHVDDILAKLSPATIETLQSPVYNIRVPKEFHKQLTHIVGPVLSSDGQGKLRFRRDIIDPLNEKAERALREVDEILEGVDGAGGPVKMLGADTMRDRTIVLLDNARWLHARSPINDQKRWLRRVRWGPEAFV